ARQHFGTEKVDLLIALTHTGDPLADAVIQELEALGPDASRQLNLGITQGLSSLENPSPAVQAFLEAAEALPDWVDLERLKRGSDAYLSIGNVWITFSLGPGSLTHTYSSPSIARILVRTGNLTHMAQRRLLETGAWNIESVLPGGLLRGAKGYIHNLQVRLLHARVRTTLLKRDWDTHTNGIPINQLEMTRTWLDFTYVPFTALHQFGITFSSQELADLYHFWQYIAYLLGIDERLYRAMTDQQQAREILALIDSTSEGANEDSKILTQAMLEAVSTFLQPILKLPTSTTFDLVSAITRRLHGDALADQLAIKKTWLSLTMPLITLANRLQRAWERRSPAARKHAVARTVAAFEQFAMTGTTVYQRNASDPTEQRFPQTTDPLAQ
ncbi:MAG TPA: oxygenase MpaB family protein, partial [Ktedonosporobacter sp.]|nr:oxygenase MpaB family protein [Ktedonosporobacter sp.]